jgi:hypothetical protein
LLIDHCYRNGPTETHRHEPIPRNDFLRSLDGETEETGESSLVQSLDDSVESWTDYLKAHLHPRSVYELPNTFYGVTPFDNYSSGQGFFKEEEQLEEVENRLRFFVEECDHLQVCLSCELAVRFSSLSYTVFTISGISRS